MYRFIINNNVNIKIYNTTHRKLIYNNKYISKNIAFIKTYTCNI